MRASPILITALLVLWTGMSIWWLSCRILGYCGNASEEPRPPELILELQEGMTLNYALSRNGESGLSLLPAGHDEDIFNILLDFQDSMPGGVLHIISMDPGTAGDIFELLQLNGADTARMRSIIDKERGPVRIVPATVPVTAGADETPADEPVAAGDIVTPAEPVPPVEAQDVDNDPLPPSKVPCPQLYTRAFPPGMAHLLYPEYSARVRCTVNLRIFADAAAGTLSGDSTMQLVLTGHSDPSEAGRNTKDLALVRAENLRDFMAGRGLPAERILAVSAGSDLPVGDSETPEGRMMNRRVEVSWDRLTE